MSTFLGDNVYSLRPSGAAVAAAGPRAGALQRCALWELPSGCHCLVVGTCLPIERLRQLLDELFGGSSKLDDFELHASVVCECASRNKVSERVQQELDLRHRVNLERSAGARDEAALLDHWRDAAATGDVAGALWAIVTHPAGSIDLQERLLRDLHMIQHRALAAIREERDTCERFALENAALRWALEQQAKDFDSPSIATARNEFASRYEHRGRARSAWRDLFTKLPWRIGAILR